MSVSLNKVLFVCTKLLLEKVNICHHYSYRIRLRLSNNHFFAYVLHITDRSVRSKQHEIMTCVSYYDTSSFSRSKLCVPSKNIHHPINESNICTFSV